MTRVQTPLPPFPPNMSGKIENVLIDMEAHQFRLAQEPFTIEELKLLFVDPQDRDVLSRAWDLVEPSGTVQELYTTPNAALPFDAHIIFSWHRFNTEKAFYVPHLAGSKASYPVSVRADAPAPLQDRFNGVYDQMVDVAYRFSQAIDVFKKLNDYTICKTPAQMRYVWPCLYTLVRKAGFPENAQLIAHPSERAGASVVVPPALLSRLKPTNDTVMRAMLVADITTNEKLPVHYRLKHSYRSN